MAKAIGCPTGFAVSSKGRESGSSQQPDPSLSRLHQYQASPAGLIEAHVTGLVSTVALLKDLSDDPILFRMIANEATTLDGVHVEIGKLIFRISHSRGIPS
jgi:hypothetical protein